MDPLHVHLFLNHVPVIGTIGALLFLAWGLVRRSVDVTLAALVALVVVAVITVPVFLTGGSAEERVESIAEVTEARIEKHQDAAVAAIVGIESTAAVALAALVVWWNTRRFPLFAATAALVLGIAASALILRAAALGGEIRHTELTSAQAVAVTNDP